MESLAMPLELEGIQCTIEHLTSELPETSNDDLRKKKCLSALGERHVQRYDALGELSDLEKAINYVSTALALTFDDDPDFSSMHQTLAAAYRARFQSLGEVDDIEKAIKSAYIAIDLTPDDRLDSLGKLTKLVLFLIRRSVRLDDPDDLKNGLKYESCAVKLIPEGHPDLLKRLSALAKAHVLQFQKTGGLDDLEKAIEYESRVLALTPEGRPDLATRLGNLGELCSHRFDRLGKPDDLNNAIEYESRALILTPEGHPDFPMRLGNLGASHCQRFKLLGELSELETAIEYQSRALSLTRDGDNHLPTQLANLGVSHKNRFQYLGELGDLDKAIAYESRAVSATPEDHPKLSRWLTNLGASYISRFQATAKYDDFENGINHQSRALKLTPEGHPYLANRLVNLGGSYHCRFNHLKDQEDLKKAIEYQLRALSLTPDDSKDLPSQLTNLASTHKDRLAHSGDLGDLEKAMEYGHRALSLIPEGHPSFTTIQSGNAQSYFELYQHTGNQSDLQQSLDYFRGASQSLTAAPRDKFRTAKQWAVLTHEYSPIYCIEAYHTMINLLPQFIWLGATADQRYQDLSMAETLAVDAAAAAIVNLEYELALEWLEHARCVVWNQYLMLRSPLDQLQSVDSDLGTQLQDVAKKLHIASSGSRESQIFAPGSATPEQVAQEHRRLAKKFNELLAQARALPKFESFLQPMKAADLIRAARYGPIVVLHCHEDRCNALLIVPGQSDISHIPLPDFTLEKAQHARSEIELSLGRQGLRERGVKPWKDPGQKNQFGKVLAELWNGIVKPVLEFLGYMNDVPKDNRPHITWCPTGALSFLPLHAAGDYDAPKSRVFDFVVSSYTPTLTALLSGTPNSLSSNSKVLAVGLESTPGHSQLLSTMGELSSVQSHVGSIAEYTQLVDSQATTISVLDAMEQSDWVHLACHAHQNVVDPTKSGFFLHDGTLDLASINRKMFKNKGLAFLSACQTAKGDKALPDEAVHLASGMLMAGFTSVIATMWSVVDADAPLVADHVYRELMKQGKVGDGEVGKALDNAVAELRQAVEEKEFERWASYIHIGS